MVRIKKAAALLIAASLLSAAMAPAAMADTRKKVGKVYLTIDTDIRVGSSGGDVEVTSTGDNSDLYYIDAVEVVNDSGDSWTRTNPPEFEITLGVEDEETHYFSSTSSSNFKLAMGSSIKNRYDDLKLLDAKKLDKGATMVLTVRLIFDEDADITSIAAPSGAEWDESHKGQGYWDEVSNAKYYQVQLIKDGSETGEIFTVYDTFYNFSNQITSEGSYRFKVRAVRSGGGKSSWISSGSLDINAEDITAVPQGGWRQAADGVRWWWQNADGTFPASQWKEVNGFWYYFDQNGYMCTGWIEVNGVQYYMDDASGAMLANTRTPDGYWVDANGAWVPGV